MHDASHEPAFERYGGLPAVARIVVDFYDRVLASPALRGHFEGIDVPRLIDHHTQLVAHAMDAPVEFDEARLVPAHAGLGVTHAEYDELCAILADTLAAHGLPDADAIDVLTRVETCRALVVA